MFQEIKRLIKHTIVYGIGGMLGKFIGFLMIPIYTRFLTTTDYGILELIDVSSYIIFEILVLGISFSILRFYHLYDNQIDKNKVVSTAIIFSILNSVLIILILSNFTREISEIIFKTDRYSYLLKIVLIAILFEGGYIPALDSLRAKGKSTVYTLISISRLVAGLSLNIYFVVILRKGVVGILYSRLIINFFTFIFLVPMVLREVKIRFDIKKLKEMLCYSIPFVPASFAMYVLHFMDRFLLGRFSNLKIVGLYSLGHKFGMILSVLITGPFYLMWSSFMFEVAKKENAKKIYARVLSYFTFIAVFFGLALSVLIKDVLKIMAAPSFFDAHKVTPLILLGYIFFGAYFVFQVGICIEKKTKWLAIITWIGGVTSVGINLILIPKYNMIGAGVTNTISFFVMSLCCYFISNKLYYIRYEIFRVLKIFLTAIGLYLFSLIITLDSILFSILLKGLLLLSFPVVLYFTNFYFDDEKDKLKEVGRIIYSKITVRG